MTTTPTYTVNNPQPSTHYYPPSAYWFVPNAGSTVTVYVATYDSNGNPVTVSSLTAVINDETTQNNVGSYTYNGGNSCQVSGTEGNGSDVYRAGGWTAQACGQLRMWATYSGHAYDTPPNAPGSLSPASGASVNSLTPTFSGTFSDPNTGDTMSQYEIVVNSGSNGSGAQVWDSGNVNASSSEISAAKFSRVYAGSALAYSSSYCWKARVADQSGMWGAWSAWQNFTTVQGPNAPSSVTPSGLQTTLTPTFSFGYSSPTAAAMASYRYTITAASGGATIYDSGTIAAAANSGTTVSGTIPSAAGLSYGTNYNFNVYATDTGGAQSPTTASAFSVAVQPQTAPTSPVGNATVNTLTPTLAWSYTDPNFTQGQYQVQVLNKTTGATLWDSGQVASAASSVAVPSGKITAYGTYIQWRVQVWDSAGIASGWSAYAFAYVNNTPTVTITSPANNGTVPSNTPTITWTYAPASGGYAQASATLTLMDTNGNTIATYTQAGTGTSYPIPAGVLTNNTSYTLKVAATDTNGNVGTSATITFTVSYTPPADMQGQPLTTNKNWLLSPYLNKDGGSGIVTQWASAVQAGAAGTFSVDPNVTQPWQLASGDGAVTGAQKVNYSSGPNTGSADLYIYQTINLSDTSWTAGTTVLSASAYALLQILSGAPRCWINLKFFDTAGGVGNQLASPGSALQGDTGDQFTRLTLANQLIPAGTLSVQLLLRVQGYAPGDQAQAWWYAAQLETNATVDAGFIAGDLGTGYRFFNSGAALNYSARDWLAGKQPAIIANPGNDSDPVSASGGTATLTWDTTLAASSGFVAYLVERRRLDAQNDDTAWITLATMTNPAISSYTDYSAGSNTTYQYSIRQQTVYADGSTGLSAHRAIVTGGVDFSPAWYVVNAEGAAIYNLRLTAVSPKRQLEWVEQAQYTQFLGRVGTARDAGPDAGYKLDLECYFNPTFGNDLAATRRTLVQMQRLNVLWYVKNPEGLVIPAYLTGLRLPMEDTRSDTMMTVTLPFIQAQDNTDY